MPSESVWPNGGFDPKWHSFDKQLKEGIIDSVLPPRGTGWKQRMPSGHVDLTMG